jgi:hypothetical protein
MISQSETHVVQWQDFKVKSEVDIVFDIAQQKGWKDCEIFGHGDMITQPVESMNWKLIPADIYEYSIPAEGADRVLQIVNAGVRIQGVIIADDERRTEPTPVERKDSLSSTEATASAEPGRNNIPAETNASLPSARAVISWIGFAVLVVIFMAGIVSFPTFLIIGLVLTFILSLGTDYDPKLIILVDDGKGRTVWVSVLTWYD